MKNTKRKISTFYIRYYFDIAFNLLMFSYSSKIRFVIVIAGFGLNFSIFCDTSCMAIFCTTRPILPSLSLFSHSVRMITE